MGKGQGEDDKEKGVVLDIEQILNDVDSEGYLRTNSKSARDPEVRYFNLKQQIKFWAFVATAIILLSLLSGWRPDLLG